MSEAQYTDGARIALETVELAKQKADSVDYLNEYIIVAEWTTPRGYEQKATLLLEDHQMGHGEGWVVDTSDSGETQTEVFGDDFDAALERFEDCLEQAEKGDSVAYA